MTEKDKPRPSFGWPSEAEVLQALKEINEALDAFIARNAARQAARKK